MKRSTAGVVGFSWAWVLALSWTAWTPVRAADEAAFFRFMSPTATVITALSAAGTVVWSNSAVGVTGGFQRATTLLGASNWADYVQCSVTARVMVLRLFDPHPPAGMVLIPGGINSGTNPLGSGESYGVWYLQNYALTVVSFYIDKYEVTKAKWDEVRTWGLTNGYTDLAVGDGKAANHPVQTVNWYDCVKWCNARSQMEGRPPAYYTSSAQTTVYTNGQINIEDNCVNWSSGYRLPTDTEWEYAGRGGAASKRFPWGGNTISHGQANYYAQNWSDYDLSGEGHHPAYTNGAMPYTSPVGAFEAGKNAYGLYDMAGNVWEWCWNWFPGWEGSARVFRGGSWGTGADYCRVGLRYVHAPNDAYYAMGFRAAVRPGQ